MKNIGSIILWFCALVFLFGCSKRTDRSAQELALDLVRETKAVPLFRAGIAKTAPASGTFRERIDALTDADIEQLFVAQFVVEWDSDTLGRILQFVRSRAGQEYLDSASAQAAGGQKVISQQAQTAFADFVATPSGKRWVEGSKSTMPRIISELFKKLGVEPAGSPNGGQTNTGRR